jgi:hypothetical protein
MQENVLFKRDGTLVDSSLRLSAKHLKGQRVCRGWVPKFPMVNIYMF